MKVIIYFGHHKVGSTALQAFLSRNHRRLLDHGILYPAVESEGLCHALAGALGRPEAPGRNMMNIREPHNALAFQILAQANNAKPPAWHGNLPGVGQMIRTLRLQVQYLQPHTVILCSEVLSNFGPHPKNLIERLKGIFPDAEYELYCVLRRPDDYLVSWHGQRLRFGERIPPLREVGIAPYRDTIHFDYRRLLEPWVAQFEDAQMYLRSYGDVMKSGGSAQDFQATISVDLPEGMTHTGTANPSIPRAAMEIIRRGNHDLDGEGAQALVQFFLSRPADLIPTPNGDVEMFGPELRAEMAAQFAPVHDYLCALSRRDFFADIDEVTRPGPVPETEAMAALLAQIDPARLSNTAARDFIAALQRDSAA